MKKSSGSLNKEIDQCKEMIWTKDKALEVRLFVHITCLILNLFQNNKF